MRQSRNFWLIVFGLAVSEIGTSIFHFAVSWIILERLSSALVMSIYLALGMAGRIMFGPIISVYTEALNKKHVVVGLDLILSVIFAALACVEPALSKMAFQLLFCATAFFLSCLSAAYAPCFSALFKESVPENYLHKGNAVRSIVNNCDSLAGILVGGILVSILPFQTILLINSGSYLLSAVSECFISYHKSSGRKISSIHFLDDLKEGAVSFYQNKSLRNVVGGLTFFNFLNYSLFVLILEYFFNQVIKSTAVEYSIVNAAMMLATILAGFFIAMLKGFAVRRCIRIGFLGSAGCSIFLISFLFYTIWHNRNILIFTAVCSMILFVSGIMDSVIDVTFETYIQKRIEEKVYVRNVSLIYTLLEILSPVSAVVGGLLLYFTGVKLLLVLLLFGYMMFIVLFLKRSAYLSFSD